MEIIIGNLGSVMGSIKMLVNVIDKSKTRGCTLRGDLDSLKDDLQLLRHVRINPELQLTSRCQLQLQELVYDVDDFIHGLSVPGELGSLIPTTIGSDPRLKLITQVGRFKERIKQLGKNLSYDVEKSSGSTSGGGTSEPARPSSAAGSPERDNLVGIEEPKEEIKGLLSSRADPHGEGMRVISIVGCRGSGKTALARELYEDEAAGKNFDYKAWVVASDPSSSDILNKILREVVPASAAQTIFEALQQFINKILRVLRLPASTPGSTSEALQNFLNKILRRWNISQALEHFQKDKRYLIFLDDVQTGPPWEDIKSAFRENIKDSRIIVTTSVLSVARACSSGSYMYTMQHLNKEDSKKLFQRRFQKGRVKNQVALTDQNIEFIVGRCDGLPMALITAAKYACRKGDLNSESFLQVSQEIDESMACSDSELKTKNNGNEIVELRRAMVEPYEKLLGGKDCLLYVSIFSSGHEINNKSLVRRLIAEGFVPKNPNIVEPSESVVLKCVRELMNQLMIEPVPIRNYFDAAKWCRVRSIMLEFTIKKAVSRNFVSLIYDGKPVNNDFGKVRRLTVQATTEPPGGMDLSAVRSVTIFNSGIPNFKECRLVRVLDLEGCHGLITPEVLRNIYGLRFLKYLSLRKTDIQELPQGVEKLQCLETLDTSENVVINLPVEVIMLPQLAYLFGKYKLTNVERNMNKLEKFFSEGKSELHTLGGICLDEALGLEVVVLVLEHAKKLKKVKAWCTLVPDSSSLADTQQSNFQKWFAKNLRKVRAWFTVVHPVPDSSSLADTLQSHLEKRCTKLESVSVHFNGVPHTFLGFLGTICTSTIGSIKIGGGIGNLPACHILETARNLRKLHLFSTGRTSQQLADLQYLKCLKYLKLAEDDGELWKDVFHVKVGGFKSLIWLCFEAPKLPSVLIDEGAMTLLCSLRLLCPVLRGIAGLPYLANLDEVILHDSASDAVVTAWKKEAKKHINRPYVEKQVKQQARPYVKNQQA